MVRELVEYMIRVKADSGQAQGKMKRLASEAVAASAGVAMASAAIVGAGVAAVGLANDLTGAVDRINTLAANSGLAAETIKGLDAIARASGKEIKNLIPKDLPKRIAEAAEGAGDAVKGFDALGISATNADGSLKSADVVLREAIDALRQIEDPTLKAAAAQQLFGARAQELTSALSSTRELEAWAQYAKVIGVDVGPEAVKTTAEWQRTTAIMMQSLEGMKNNLMPLVDLLGKTVLGLTAMGVAASGAINAVLNFEDPLVGAYRATNTWFDATKSLNAELGKTAKAVDQNAAAYGRFAETLGFDPGTQGLFGLLSDAAGGRLGAGAATPKAPKAPKAPSGTSGGAEWDADIEVAKLEEANDAWWDSWREGQDRAAERQQSITDALIAGMDTAIEAAKDLEVANAAAYQVRNEQNQMDVAQDPLGAAGSQIGAMLAPVLGPLAMLADLPSAMQTLTVAIETLPDELRNLPDLVTGLVNAISDLPSELLRALPQIALGLANAVTEAFLIGFTIVLETLAAFVRLIPGEIAQSFADFMSDFVSNLNPFDGDGKFGFGLGGPLGEVAERIPFFEEGGTVNRTGLAVVHAGEEVRPAADRMTGDRSVGSPRIYIRSNDPRQVAREVSQALGPYGIGIGLGGAF